MTFIQPVGVNNPSPESRSPVWQVYSGETWVLTTYLTLESGGSTPARPGNSVVTFKLAESQFETEPLWTGTWDAGIEEVSPQDHPGLVAIIVPDEVAAQLRRGGYRFSILVADNYSGLSYVAVDGGLLVEYATTSPQHSIPYKDVE